MQGYDDAMRLDIHTDLVASGSHAYRIVAADEVVGTLAWDGRGSFSIEAFGRSVRLHQPDALERARKLGSGTRLLLLEGRLSGDVSTQREKDGLLGVCTSYALDADGREVRGYPNPGGGRGWRMSVYAAGEQVALAKRASEPVHTPDGFQVVALDQDAALAALVLVAYDVYASYLENDGGAAGPLAFREVNLFGKRARELDDALFEARCEGEVPEDDAGAGSPASETATDRAKRLAEGFAVKSDARPRK